MDLFGPTSISIVSHKWYCLVVTDDFSRFTWTFFLKTKDETSGILRKFITEIENLKDLKVKNIRCDNGGEFRNKEMNDFCSLKGIKREFSNARTPQQNGVAERRNRTLIEAARTMLSDAKLPVTFWTEAVNTASYVQNRVLVNKSQNKTPYELFNGRTPAIGFLKPFGSHVMILNTLDNLGKFEAKRDEGYFIGYSMSRKAFRVFNKRPRRVKENLHLEFLENKAIEKGAGPNWLFDIDSLTKSMNYVPVDAGINSINLSGTKDAAGQEVKKDVSSLRYIALPNWVHDALLESSLIGTAYLNDSPEPSSDTRLISKRVANQLETPSLDNILTLTNQFEDILGVITNSVDSDGVEANVSNMETTITASPTPTLRIHKDHPKSQIIGHVDTPIQTRNKSKEVLKNKKDERGIAIRNKARLVAQRHTQEEGIDYDEVFTPVARIKAIRLLLAYASFMGFIVYQMDVKSAFLYGTIDEEVGTIDHTLFIKRQRGDFILVQVYVDDIIFRSSNPQLCREFEALMHEKFQMSAMGELNFFLGLQLLQKEDGIFLSQDKRARIAQSLALPPITDEPASPLRDVSQGEACPTDSGFRADQDRANIAKTSTLPMIQHQGLLPLLLMRAELEINMLKARVKLLEDREGGVQNDLEMMSQSRGGIWMKGRQQLRDGSIPTVGPPATEVPIGSDVVPTAGLIFATVTVVTPYTRRKGKETMVESETPKKKRFEQESAKKLKTLEEVPEEVKSPDEVLEEKIKEMMQLVPIEEVYVEALQVKHLTIDWKVYTEGQRSYWKVTSIRPPTSDKEIELWVELKRLYKPDDEDQLWTHTQNLMHAPVEWKLYDMCEVHQVTSKDKEIFMLVAKDYPLRKGLAIGMISYKLQDDVRYQSSRSLLKHLLELS
nr:putative ribonuclease H-like domain-containing protein [Tanacetum cinerariifolium]